MNFTVYRSSAGSGKTFTLVKEYLLLALSDGQVPPQKYRHILAITFTNKAAAEMKERVVNALRGLSANDHNKLSGSIKTLFEILQKELNIPPHELGARAENVLQAILHNYSDFAIGTIDGFTHKVIRTFAHDLHLPLNFEIEMDSEKLLSEAIDLLMSRIGSDEQLTRALVEFTEAKADEEKNWDIEYDLAKFASNLLKEDGEIHLKNLRELTTKDFFTIRDEVAGTIKKFEAEVKSIAGEALSLLQKNELTAESFYQGRNGIHTYFRKLKEGDVDYIRPNSHVARTVSENKWPGGKTSSIDKAKIENIKPVLVRHFNDLQALAEKEYEHYVLCREINRRIYSLAVLNEIEKLMIEHKKENNVLHISEFNRIIANIVMHQPVPFIYERLGEKFNHFLLDEFQDTSFLQWNNLLPLIDNSLAENNFNMLVGDGKQSIYRWRGGEVELFAQLPKVSGSDQNTLLKERERSLENHFRLKNLDKNFRSKREIVELNNELFRFASQTFLPQAHQQIYSDLEQEADPTNTGGYIRIEFLPRETEDINETARSKTLELVRELQKENFRLKDIAIITRNNKEGSLIASHLIGNNIGVISSESLLLKNSAEVNFLVSLLRFIDEPGDIVPRTGILQYLIANNKIKEEDFHTRLVFINSATAISGLLALLKEHGFDLNASILAKMPLYELSEELVRIFGLGNKAPAYVQFFLDEILAYGLRNPNNISEFLNWWGERSEKASVIVPEAMDAVNVMTIHRSKGLEFPAVIMPYANWQMDKGKDELWIEVDESIAPKMSSALVPNSKALEKTVYAPVYQEEYGKALLDNINLLYVAMTRPSERLYMITTFPGPKKNLSKIFTGFLEHKMLFDPNKLIYEFGKGIPHKQKESILTQSISLGNFISHHWRDKVQIRQSAGDAWDDSEKQEKRSSGILLHNALARVIDHTQVKSALEAMLNEGLLTGAEEKEMELQLNALLSVQDIRKFFEPGRQVKNESELLMPGGESFRPDRVIIQDKKAIVLDYKTGIEKKTHKKQLD
ncbi:MAG TPA: UvrD-helicase domain-containing protein, partial [Bacteroidia bacterium]